jgi:hypothetical protein
VFDHRQGALALANWDPKAWNAGRVEKETTILDNLTWGSKLLGVAEHATVKGGVQKELEGLRRAVMVRAMDKEVVNKGPDLD